MFNERYVWLPYVFATLYTGVCVAFAFICDITEQSPNTVKLYIYWMVIDMMLCLSMIGFYFMQKSLFKRDGMFTKNSRTVKHNFFLEMCSLEEKESMG